MSAICQPITHGPIKPAAFFDRCAGKNGSHIVGRFDSQLKYSANELCYPVCLLFHQVCKAGEFALS